MDSAGAKLCSGAVHGSGGIHCLVQVANRAFTPLSGRDRYRGECRIVWPERPETGDRTLEQSSLDFRPIGIE